MSVDTPVVWLDEGEARQDAAHALAEWARARGIRLGAPADRSTSSTAVDPSLADRAEKEIERAREAISATDADTAERALARAESLLRQHPELPEGAWLRAEVERTWSSRWLRVEPRDEARARAAWENAAALDGGRVPGVGETTFPPRPRAKATIIVTGGGRLSLRLDGVPIESTESDARGAVFRVAVAPAEHHLLAMSEGAVVFASWIALSGAESAEVHITVDDGGTCTRDHLSEVRRDGDHVSAPGVACPRWLAATPGEKRGSVLVARCERDTCGPLLEWRVDRYETTGPPQSHGKDRGWPAWATWTLVGIGGVAAASAALIATGVFEARPVEPRFVVGGARQE